MRYIAFLLYATLMCALVMLAGAVMKTPSARRLSVYSPATLWTVR